MEKFCRTISVFRTRPQDGKLLHIGESGANRITFHIVLYSIDVRPLLGNPKKSCNTRESWL